MQARDAPGIATRSLNAIEGFNALMAEARSAAEAGVPPSELLELIYDRTGYLKELQESPDLQEQGRAENLEELVSVAREFEDLRRRRRRARRWPISWSRCRSSRTPTRSPMRRAASSR